MKKVVMSVAVAGLVTSLSAADLGSNDAAYLFAQNDVNVVTLNSMEMVQTEGQVLSLLSPVLGLVEGLLGTVVPVVGNLVGALPAVLGAVNPIGVDVQVGSLLDVNLNGTINSALPSLVGALL